MIDLTIGCIVRLGIGEGDAVHVLDRTDAPHHVRGQSDDLAVRGQQRPAGVAGVDRRVRLDQVLHEDVLAQVAPPEPAHDADGDAVAVFEQRAADGDDGWPSFSAVGVAEGQRLQIRRPGFAAPPGR